MVAFGHSVPKFEVVLVLYNSEKNGPQSGVIFHEKNENGLLRPPPPPDTVQPPRKEAGGRTAMTYYGYDTGPGLPKL